MALASLAAPAHAQPPAPAASAVPPVITAIRFEGNRRLSDATLTEATKLRPGALLDAATIKPDLQALQARYADAGGAVVAPSIIETALGKVTLTYQVREGVKAWPETGEAGPYPKFLQAYFGNTLVCAAARTGEDLCHMWLEKDGSFVIFDPTGAHRGHFTVGRLRPDGRVPICRFWETSSFMPPAPANMVLGARPVTKGPNGEEPGMVCETKGFRSTCTRYPDLRVLTAEQQRKARRTMVERNHEEGMCYAHGPHKVGETWFEWDDPLPGQIGLDREMLLPGHQ